MVLFSDEFLGVMKYSLANFALLKKTWDSSRKMFENVKAFFDKLTRKKRIGNCNVHNLLDKIAHNPNSIIPVTDIRGDLAPLIELKKFDSESFLDAAYQIKESLKSRHIVTGQNTLMVASKVEWHFYGASLQSNDASDIQIIQISEVEEAINIPVVVSSKTWLKNYAEMLSGSLAHESKISGGVVSIDSAVLAKMIGALNVKKLKSFGCTSAIVADEDLINLSGIDIDCKPEILIKKPTDVFLGYLWVIYIDRITLEYCPISEYGNLGEKESYDLLKDKLIHQIEFFKKKVWNDWGKKPEERRFVLAIALHDQLLLDIKYYFDDVYFPNSRAEVLEKILSDQ
jgi:hypothetical protein